MEIVVKQQLVSTIFMCWEISLSRNSKPHITIYRVLDLGPVHLLYTLNLTSDLCCKNIYVTWYVSSALRLEYGKLAEKEALSCCALWKAPGHIICCLWGETKNCDLHAISFPNLELLKRCCSTTWHWILVIFESFALNLCINW